MRISRDRDIIQGYLTDESGVFNSEEGSVEAVFYPESEEDIAQIMKEANETDTRITVSGGGTSITGSRVPMHGGAVISMERMLQTRPYPDLEEVEYKGLAGNITFYLDNDDLIAHIPPGMLLRELAGALPPTLFYPPDPTESTASIGGTVATNASGARSFKYGPTRAWISGLRIVLANGEVLSVQRGQTNSDKSGHFRVMTESGRSMEFNIPDLPLPDVKNAAGVHSKRGMDLIDLFIGSEGIFGVYSEITVRLEPKPASPALDLAFFRNPVQALEYVDRIREFRSKGIMSLEYFDENSIQLARVEYPQILEDVKAAVFTELIAPDIQLMDELAKAQTQQEAVDDWCALTSSDIRDLKEFRHSLPDGVNAYLKQHQSYKLGTDFAVPPENFREMMDAYRKTGEEFRERFPRAGMHYTIFGHIGQYHVHFNFITHDIEELAFAKKLYLGLARKAVELGGTISAEHGVGKKTVEIDGEERPYLELMYGPEHLKKISALKKVFDPKTMLNVGNITPEGQ